LCLSSGNIPQDFKTTKPKETTYVTNYNYMAFMGADWKKLAFSYGGGYLTPFFQYKKIEKRELAANKLASALMIRYSHDLFNLKAITYILEDASSGNFKMTDQVNIDSATVSAINSYKVKGSFYRLGGEVFFPDSISLGADLLFGNINYKEFTSGGSNTIDVKSNEYLIYLKKQFGHFITLKAVMKANNTKLDGVISSTTLTDEVTSTYYGGVFELLF